MKRNITSIWQSVDQLVWHAPVEQFSRAQAWLVQFARLTVVLARDLTQGQLTLRAMGLVYTTLLSIVPLLAISFSVLKAFGVYNQIEPMLQSFLEPLGDRGTELTARITGFIQNMNVGVLGSVGLALLLYTAVSLVQKVEEAFNYIWHVSRGRSIGERFSRYVSALLVGPLLVFSAIGLTAAAMSLGVVREAMQVEPISWFALHVGRLLPYALVIGAFTFLYTFMPNTKVRIGAALVGGVVGGVVWQSAGWIFAQFAAASTRYAAIYSSFAILILFMMWLYLSWLILLFGSSVAFYTQNPEYLLKDGGDLRLSNRMNERLAMIIMCMVGRYHIEGKAPWTSDAFSQVLRIPVGSIDDVLMVLRSRSILMTTSDDPPGWLPVRDLSEVNVKDVLDAVRTAGEDTSLKPQALRGSASVESVIARMDGAVEEALAGTTIIDLASERTNENEEQAWLTS